MSVICPQSFLNLCHLPISWSVLAGQIPWNLHMTPRSGRAWRAWSLVTSPPQPGAARRKGKDRKGRERTRQNHTKSISIYLDHSRSISPVSASRELRRKIPNDPGRWCKHWEQHRDHRATSLRTSLNDSVYITLYRSAWFVWVFLISHDQSKKVENISACEQEIKHNQIYQSEHHLRTPYHL